MSTLVYVDTPEFGLLPIARVSLPASDIRVPAEQVPGLLHWTAQSTELIPAGSADVQAPVSGLALTARSTKSPDAVPAVCDGTVAVLPPTLEATTKPAVLNTLEQLFDVLQLLPSRQHLRGLLEVMDSPDSVTVTVEPSAADG
jgi:hypothetical protein